MATPTADPQIKLPQQPARKFGYKSLPAFPIDVPGMVDTLFRLKQREQTLQGLLKTYTIGGRTARAREFLFGDQQLEAKEAGQLTIAEAIAGQTESMATSGGERTTLPLDDPRPGSISWTTFPDVHSLGAPYLDEFAAARPEQATAAFWPTIATYGRSYNLLLPLVRVGGGDNALTTFSRQGSTASAWVYALQAAKVSVTVFGIWLGHVYQWHIVPAALLMTMFENLSPKHPLYRLLEPQSNYVIPFDDLLLAGWDTLPGSLATAPQLLALVERWARTRSSDLSWGLAIKLFGVDGPKPFNDAMVESPETLCPFVTVDRIHLPRPDISANAEKGDGLAFNQWRVTDEHRPLGEIVQVRRIYSASAKIRRVLNHQPASAQEVLA